MKQTPHDREAGFTLIELIVSLTILSVVTGALSAAFITTNNANANTAHRIHQSNDAQLISGFWTADAQAAGGTNPYTAQVDTTLGVSRSDDGGCATGGGAALVARFKWKEWASRSSDAAAVDTYTTRVANYVYRSATRELERRTCANGTPKSVLTLATRVASAPTVNCNPVACPTLPDTVTMTVTEATDPSAPTPYSFTLTASMRAVGETKPDGSTGASTPLLALGSSTCSSGATGLSATGSGSVVVNGQAVVNAADIGACHAMTLNTNFSYSAGGTSILAGGSLVCTGPGNCPPYTNEPIRIGDPYGYLTPPAGTCSGGSNPTAPGGNYLPNVYPQAVAVSGSANFAPGNYVFCNGISFSGSGTVTAIGVLFYVSGGSTPFSVAGGTTLTMSASTSAANPYAGLLLWNATVNPVIINGSSTTTTTSYGGAIYSPNADVQLNGSQSLNIGSIVAKRILFSGGGTTNVVGGDATRAFAPSNLTATSGPGLRQVHLSWTAPTYTGTTPITGYEYRANRNAGSFGAWTAVPGGLVTTYDDTCGISDTTARTCAYQVRAVNGAGGGAASNTASAAALVDTGAPTVTISAPTANGHTGLATNFTGTAGNQPGDSSTVVVKLYNTAACTGVSAQTYNVTRVATAWTIPSGTMSPGSKCVVATQTDWLVNTGTSGPVSFTAGYVANVVLANRDGQLAKADTVTVTFGQAMNPGTLCTSWNGTGSRSTITVAVTNGVGAANDTLTVTDSACAFKFGTLDLGSPNWVTATTSFSGSGGNASTAVFDATLTTLTIKVGNGTSGPVNVAAQTAIYTPDPAMKDGVGTAMSGIYSFINQRF